VTSIFWQIALKLIECIAGNVPSFQLFLVSYFSSFIQFQSLIKGTNIILALAISEFVMHSNW